MLLVSRTGKPTCLPVRLPITVREVQGVGSSDLFIHLYICFGLVMCVHHPAKAISDFNSAGKTGGLISLSETVRGDLRPAVPAVSALSQCKQ